MKHILILIIIFFVIGLVHSQQYEDVVYLKSGSIIHGIIIEQIPNESIKIKTKDDNVFVFKMEEIEKITKEDIKKNDEKNQTINETKGNKDEVTQTRVYYRDSKNLAGIGISVSSYSTWWNDYISGLNVEKHDYYLKHIHKRTVLIGFYERMGLFKLGPVRFNVRGEFQFGFLGGSEQDWLSSNSSKSISEGGTTIGGLIMLKFCYPIQVSSFRLIPHVGTAYLFSHIEANGDGFDINTSDTSWGYQKGLSEDVHGFILDLGLSIDFKKIMITPEYRFSVLGGGDIDSHARGTITNNDYVYNAFVLNVGFKF